MSPQLGVPLEIPTKRMMELAASMEVAARQFLDRARGNEDWRLSHLGDTLAMLTVAVRNVAVSGPRSHQAALERMFPEEYPDRPNEPDPLVQQRAHADVISFLAIGDMALADIAALVLEREGLPANDNPWPRMMDLVDCLAEAEPRGALVNPARELDLTLREARHRLVAHRLHAQAYMFTWERDAFSITLVDPAGLRQAYELLKRANERVRLPAPAPSDYTYSEYSHLRDWVLGQARHLDAEGRRLVRQAFRAGAYDLHHPVKVGNALLGLAAAAADYSKPAGPAD